MRKASDAYVAQVMKAIARDARIMGVPLHELEKWVYSILRKRDASRRRKAADKKLERDEIISGKVLSGMARMEHVEKWRMSVTEKQKATANKDKANKALKLRKANKAYRDDKACMDDESNPQAI